MYLRTFKKCVLKYMNSTLWRVALRKAKVKFDLLTDIDMLLMVEKDIRGEICQSIHRFAKPDNKYMKKYDKNKEF